MNLCLLEFHCGERYCTLQVRKRLSFTPRSLTGLMAANGQSKLWEEHTNKNVTGSSLEDVQQNSSIPIFSTLLKRKLS